MTRQSRLTQELTRRFSPIHLEVIDESMNHHVPQGAESHFKVILVSDGFNALSKIARHRLVNQALALEFETGMHALSLHLFTEEEWVLRNKRVWGSPECEG
jgi:BolA protein